MTSLVQSILDFIGNHPHIAGLIAFLSAAAEAIPVIGSLAPGSAILVGLGAFVGMGRLDLIPLLGWSIAGAVLADGLSYWLGHNYRDRLYTFRPFAKRRDLMAKAEVFIARYGGRSVFAARFVPVMRAFVPVIVGTAGMPPLRFYTANIASALLWAPAHILPGALIGLTFAGIGAVSSRLVIILIALALLAFSVLYVFKHLLAASYNFLPRIQERLMIRARARQDRLGALIERFLMPGNSNLRLFVLLNTILVGAIIGFAALLEDVISRDQIVLFDTAFSQFLQSLRTTWSDNFMVAVTMLGDWNVSLPVAIAACAVLVIEKRYRLASGLALALVSTTVFVQGMKLIIRTSRPIALYSGADAFSFPSGHATITTVLYGILSLIIFRGRERLAARTAIVFAAFLIATISFSRIYLAAHWPSDVLAGLLFGAGTVAVFAMVFHDHELSARLTNRLIGACAAALLVFGGWHVAQGYPAALSFYARQPQKSIVLSKPWREGGWRRLPKYRVDLVGESEEPFLLQWRGAVRPLREALLRQGWVTPQPWTLASLNLFVSPNASADKLPVIPQLHQGRLPSITMIKSVNTSNQHRRYVLRAWREKIIAPGGKQTSILLGSISFEQIKLPLGQLSLPFQVEGRACKGDVLIDKLPHATSTGTRYHAGTGACGGQLVLAAP